MNFIEKTPCLPSNGGERDSGVTLVMEKLHMPTGMPGP